MNERLPIWKRAVFSVIFVVGFLLLTLVAAETGLRLAGFGNNRSLLVESGNGQFLETNPRFCWQFFDPAVSRDPLPLRCAMDKPDGTKRAVVLGGSAAQGFPEAAYGFHRQLEVMLDSADPQADWEVINLAITAVNSHVVRSVAKEVHKLRPDVILIYMGNNEVVGPFGPGTAFASFQNNIALIRFSLWAKSTRTGQAVEAIHAAFSSRNNLSAWQGMSMMQDYLVAFDDPRLRSTYRHFQENLEAILDTLSPLDIPILLATVPVNLKDCSPFGIPKNSEQAMDPNRIQSLINQAAHCLQAHDPLSAKTLLEAALQLDPTNPDLHFRIARLFDNEGQKEMAMTAYSKARDYDALRFRADSRINQIIRETAQSNATAVRLVDLENLMGPAGRDLFFEHVHLTFRGSHATAMAFFRNLQLGGLIPETSDPLPIDACSRALAFDKIGQGLQLQRIDGLARRPPFTRQLDYLENLERLHTRQAELGAGLTAKSYEECIDLHRQAILKRPVDPVLHARLAYVLMECGKYAEAARQFEQYADLSVLDFEIATDREVVRFHVGDRQAALERLRELRTAYPLKAKPLVELLKLLSLTGRSQEALDLLEQTDLPIPSDSSVRSEKVKLSLALGKPRQAKSGLLKILMDNPYDFGSRKAILELIQPKSPDADNLISQDVVFLSKTPRSRRNAYSLLSFYREMNRPDLSENLTKEILARGNSANMLAAVADTLIETGQSEAACDILDVILKLNPLALDERNNLAWILATTRSSEQQRERSLQLSREVLSASKCPPASAYGTYAAALAANGQIEEAILTIERAIQINTVTQQLPQETLLRIQAQFSSSLTDFSNP